MGHSAFWSIESYSPWKEHLPNPGGKSQELCIYRCLGAGCALLLKTLVVVLSNLAWQHSCAQCPHLFFRQYHLATILQPRCCCYAMSLTVRKFRSYAQAYRCRGNAELETVAHCAAVRSQADGLQALCSMVTRAGEVVQATGRFDMLKQSRGFAHPGW